MDHCFKLLVGGVTLVDRVIANEQQLVGTLANYTPMVETYIQNLRVDDNLGSAPKDDRYFLGKLGRHRVLVLQQKGVESLSDYSGVIYEPYDNASGLWQFTLVKELQAQGYDNVSADMLTRSDAQKKTS